MRNTAYIIILFSILILSSCSKNESNQCRIGKINLISPKFNYSHDFDFIYDRNGELISTQRTAGLSKPKEIGSIEESFLFKDERLIVKYEIINGNKYVKEFIKRDFNYANFVLYENNSFIIYSISRDLRGNISSISEFNEFGKLLEKYEYQNYDGKKNVFASLGWQINFLNQRFEFENFNDGPDGNPAKILYYKDKDTSNYSVLNVVYGYDENNIAISARCTANNGKELIYTYSVIYYDCN